MQNQRAEEIYQKIKNNLKNQKGRIVAIDLESGDYFIGNDVLEACEIGRKKHPNKQFYLKRIGAKAVFFVGAI